MQKVLIIQGEITEYRVPIFNELAKSVDLTVLYSEKELPNNIEFKTLKIPTKKVFGRIIFHRGKLRKICNNFDVVISMFNLNYFHNNQLAFGRRKYKLIYWGIGVSASLNKRYDEKKGFDFIRKHLIKKADAALFYSSYPVEKYSKLGVKKEKLFVAHNTLYIDEDLNDDNPSISRDSILFLGTLYRQKRIDILFEQYNEAYLEEKNIPHLYVIGGGEMFNDLKLYIEENGLESKITMVGPVYSQEGLNKYFNKSLGCFSIDQAGLSVLQSMGRGVPFITFKNAITGGEIFNIEHEINGLLLDNTSDIKNVILDMKENPHRYLQMGVKAREYYVENRGVKHMVQGFLDAINYVMNTEKNN